MDDSSGMKRQTERNWKKWLGIGLAVIVVVGLIVLIAASAGGGSGGLY